MYPIQTPTGMTAWVVTRYDDCAKILKDKRIFANPASVPSLNLTYQDIVQDELIADIIFNSLVSMDPPDHTRIRRLAHQVFTPRMVKNLEGKISKNTKELFDEVQGAGEIDFVEKIAFPLPIIVICDMLGIPNEDRQLFSDWSESFFVNQNIPENFHLIREMILEFVPYMREIFTARSKKPQDDLISALVQAQEEEEKLSEHELYSLVFQLMAAGHETTVNLIGNGTLALLENPDQFAKLKEQPELVGSAIEEFVRYCGSVEVNLDRYIGEDLEIHGQQLKAGDMLVAVLASANRDEKHFENPNKMDITRTPNKHIGFGNGIHSCIGAPLARLESRICFTTLVERMPNLALNVDPSKLKLKDAYVPRGLEELPVRF